MSLFKRIAKKIRRRFRTKGQRQDKPNWDLTTAEKLIMNNWNIRFSNTLPKYAGLQRARKREQANRKPVPTPLGVSRQVRRWRERKGYAY